MEQTYYHAQEHEVCHSFSTSMESGLTGGEVAKLRSLHGGNKLEKEEEVTFCCLCYVMLFL